jgi:MOSC domain-containing protein YiiM
MPQEPSVTVERIFICPARDATQIERERVTVEGGKGVVGDRNFGVNKHPEQNLTLVEAEEIEGFCVEQGRVLDLSLTRRNLITRGVRLNQLVNVEFSIGNVRMRGVELCEPCVTLGSALSSESLASHAVIKWWVGRGGLRVDVLSDGELVVGTAIETGA